MVESLGPSEVGEEDHGPDSFVIGYTELKESLHTDDYKPALRPLPHLIGLKD